MSIATDYIVRAKFEVDGQPEQKLKGVASAADGAGARVDSLGSKLKGLVGVIGGGALAVGAKKLFVDFNSNLEQAQLRMAGLFQLNTGGSFNANLAKSVDLVGKLQQRAKSSVGETSDFVQMAADLVGPLTGAKASMKDIEDITAGATVAARSFGIEAGMASLDLQQALMGQLAGKDRFARALLEPMGYSTKSFNALSSAKRMEELARAFRQPALRALGEAQGKSFEGQLSTLTDNLKMGLGKVGLPLFQAVTAELVKWNAWIDANPGKISAFAEKASRALVDGFKAVKEGLIWVDRNRDILMTIAKAALVMKGASMIGSLVASPFQALASLGTSLSSAGKSAGGFVGAMNGATSQIGRISTLLGLVGAGASAAAGFVLDAKERQIGRQADTGATVDFFAAVAQGKARMPTGPALHSRIEDALASGVLTRDQNGRFGINAMKFLTGQEVSGVFGQRARSAEAQGIDRLKATGELALAAKMNLLAAATQDAARAYTVGWQMAQVRVFGGLVDAATQTLTATERNRVSKRASDVKIGTVKVEVAAKDPERWISELLDEVGKKAARVPRRARGALRGEGAV
jgi:hypothetical protein